MVKAKIMTDGNIKSLGFLTLLTPNISMICPKCGLHVQEGEDDFERVVKDLELNI